MAPKVNYMPRERIESEAMKTICDYGRKFGVIARPPIPAEEILESLLGLTLGFDNLPEILNTPGILGATWVLDRKVLIDETLDPEVYPWKEGRFRFTVAHEIGHWQLHSYLYLSKEKQLQLFDTNDKPSIVCRAKDRKEPMEWQADTFAGYLLMPEEMVRTAWLEKYGKIETYMAEKEIGIMSDKLGLGEDNDRPTVEIAREIATDFKVSGQAMQIRLIGMGLIQVKDQSPSIFDGGGIGMN